MVQYVVQNWLKQDRIAVDRILTLTLSNLSYCLSISLLLRLNSTSLCHTSSSLHCSALLKVQGTYLKSSFQEIILVFLSNLQVTAYWITNLSLNRSSFLFLIPSFTAFFLSTAEISEYWVSKTFIHSFIEAQLFRIELKIEYELQYVHSLLAIPHHQLKDK